MKPVQLPSRKVHVLKCWSPFFDEVGEGEKTYEVRKDDRVFRVGDILRLEERNPNTEEKTGRWLTCFVSHKLDGGQFGVRKGYCVLGIQLPANHQWPIKLLQDLQ